MPLHGIDGLAAVQHSGIGMPAGHQQLEDEHGQGEAVVLLAACRRVEWLPEQLRRQVVVDADSTAVDLARAELDAVAIDDADTGVSPDENIAVVEIADDDVVGVQGGDGAGYVVGDLDDESIRGSGQQGETIERGYDLMQEVSVLDRRHDEAGRLAGVLVDHDLVRPGGNGSQLGYAGTGKLGQLGGMVVIDRLVIDFGDDVGPAGEREDFSLAALADLLIEEVGLAGVGTDQARRYVDRHGLGLVLAGKCGTMAMSETSSSVRVMMSADDRTFVTSSDNASRSPPSGSSSRATAIRAR